jgi:hypothetical protein
LLIEAWSRYRPSSKENSPRAGEGARKKDLAEIYGDSFMTKLLNGIKQKQYRTKEDGNKFGDDDKLKEHLNKLLVVAN